MATDLRFTAMFSVRIAFIKRAYYYGNEYRLASMLVRLLFCLCVWVVECDHVGKAVTEGNSYGNENEHT
jgi:hypothetical protein